MTIFLVFILWFGSVATDITGMVMVYCLMRSENEQAYKADNHDQIECQYSIC